MKGRSTSRLAALFASAIVMLAAMSGIAEAKIKTKKVEVTAQVTATKTSPDTLRVDVELTSANRLCKDDMLVGFYLKKSPFSTGVLSATVDKRFSLILTLSAFQNSPATWELVLQPRGDVFVGKGKKQKRIDCVVNGTQQASLTGAY